MIVGFTGSRDGPETVDQLEMVRMVFESLGTTTLHHGDCEGWDKAADTLAVELGIAVTVHPPSNSSLRAFCKGAKHTVLQPRSYLDRNRNIVDACDVLVACPGPRSRGSLYTMRYAATQTRLTYEVNRTGLVEKHTYELVTGGL